MSISSPSRCWRWWTCPPSGLPCPAARPILAPAVGSAPRRFQTRSEPARLSRWAPADPAECPWPDRCYGTPAQTAQRKFLQRWCFFFLSRRLRNYGGCVISPCKWCSDSFRQLRHWGLGTAAGWEMQPKYSRVGYWYREQISRYLSKMTRWIIYSHMDTGYFWTIQPSFINPPLNLSTCLPTSPSTSPNYQEIPIHPPVHPSTNRFIISRINLPSYHSIPLHIQPSFHL